MFTRRTTDDAVADEEVVDDRPSTAVVAHPWSPAQIVALVIGILAVLLGATALFRTGFPTDHLDTPHELAWGLDHSPLLGAITVAFGVLMLLAAVVPGGLRSLMGLLSVIALVLGIGILADVATSDVTRWLTTKDANGWTYVIVGAIGLIAAFFSPVVFGAQRRRYEHRRHLVS